MPSIPPAPPRARRWTWIIVAVAVGIAIIFTARRVMRRLASKPPPTEPAAR